MVSMVYHGILPWFAMVYLFKTLWHTMACTMVYFHKGGAAHKIKMCVQQLKGTKF